MLGPQSRLERDGTSMTTSEKTALVTGASSGIGEATALALAEAGWNVALNYLTFPERATGIKERIERLGRKCACYEVDVSDLESVEQMVERIDNDFAGIDGLVTCAVYSDREPFHTADIAGFRKTLDVTMWGTFHALRAVTNKMLSTGRAGSIVIVGSPHAVIPVKDCMAYNISKAAVVQMARTAAAELTHYGIRVNVIHPGWTDTPGEKKFFSEKELAEGASEIPAGRLARPSEIARGIVFLMADESEYVIGTELTIDGGIGIMEP